MIATKHIFITYLPTYIYLYFCFYNSIYRIVIDIFKTKEKKPKKKTNKEKDEKEEKIDFEEYTENQGYATFHQMNLSRPLLKVCAI